MKCWTYFQIFLSIVLISTLTACLGDSGFNPSTTLKSDLASGVLNRTPATPIPTATPSGTATPSPTPYLQFVTQPSGGGVATGFSQQPAVGLYDASGNAVSANIVVKLSLLVQSGTGGLRGVDTNFRTTSGVATFSDVSISAAGTYKLIATASGYASATSSVIVIAAPAGTTYYVSPTGSDSNNGKSTSTAWQTVANVNSTAFTAGDTVLFQGGQTFSGCLNIDSRVTSTPSQPLTIGSYGTGKFTLNANCTHNENPYSVLSNTQAVRIGKVSGFVLQDCTLVGNEPAIAAVNPQPSPTVYGAAYGVLFDNNGYQSGLTTSSVTIQRCDISSFYTTKSTDYGGEIFFNSQGPTSQISILDNVLHGASGVTSADDNGIGGSGNAERYNLTNLAIEGNHIYNIGARPGGLGGTLGNGIVIAGAKVLIQNNVVHDNGAAINTCGGSANIWAASADRVTIQYNESYRNRPSDLTLSSGGGNSGGCDWDGFDLDLNVTNSIVQYNYSHDNFGAGYLAYYVAPWGPNTYQYNISVGDAATAMGFGALTISDYGNASGVVNIYNNLFDTTASNGLIFNSGGSGFTGYIANNIFRAGIDPGTGFSKFTNSNGATPSITFTNNAYWSASSTASNSYFNWGTCSPFNVCHGVAAWQSQTGNDSLAQILNAPSPSPMSSPGSTITCTVSQITSARDGTGLVACLGSNYTLPSGSVFKGTGLDLSVNPYLLSPAKTDFFGNPVITPDIGI